MNAAQSLRVSYYGQVLTGLPPHPSPRQFPFSQRRSVAVPRRRTFRPIDYADYKAQCDLERAFREVSTVEARSTNESKALSSFQQFVRLFTFFPYRDLNYFISLAFMIGGAGFFTGGIAQLLMLLVDPLNLPPNISLVPPVANAIGATMFTSGGLLSFPAAWNADKGTTEEVKSVDGLSTKYRPARLGDPVWVWNPSREDVAKIASTTPFKAGLIQLTGGLVLSVSSVCAFPGVIDPNNTMLNQILRFFPLAFGGGCFSIANLWLLIWVQPVWYKPAVSSVGWHSILWSSIGSFHFFATGVLLLLSDFNDSAFTGLVASFGFFAGAAIHLYDLMGFYSDDWFC